MYILYIVYCVYVYILHIYCIVLRTAFIFLSHFTVSPYPVSSPMTSVTTDGTTTTALMVQQPTVVQTVISFGPYPAAMTCPHCHASIVTAISYSEGLLVWLMVGMLCIVG